MDRPPGVALRRSPHSGNSPLRHVRSGAQELRPIHPRFWTFAAFNKAGISTRERRKAGASRVAAHSKGSGEDCTFRWRTDIG
jgi:hypothetical protein